jgi:hypothetical protein
MSAHKLRARMRPRRLLRFASSFALVSLAASALAACGVTHKPFEPVREGLSTPLGGLHYTVFLTRELNLKNEEDSGYVPGVKEAAPGRGLYGVFLQACNTGKTPVAASDQFKIVDTQGNTFQPTSLNADNPFAYHGRLVQPENCDPVRGSLAEQGPTSGAMLLFDLPLAATENRPMELHIQGPMDQATGKAEEAIVILDI